MMVATHVTRQLSAIQGQVQTTPASVHLGTREMDGAVLMSMNVQLASIAVAPTLCASICQEATDVNAGVVMSLQMTGTLAS